MVNLEKEQNNRKRISLIKPQNSEASAFPSNITDSIKCEPLSYDCEPRTEHPVYTRQQYAALNQQRSAYKDPEKFDVFPQPAPRDLNFPAVPPCQQSLQQNQHTARKQNDNTYFPIRNGNIQKSQIDSNSSVPNLSAHKNFLILLSVLIGVFIFILLLKYAPAFALFLLVLFINFLKIKYE